MAPRFDPGSESTDQRSRALASGLEAWLDAGRQQAVTERRRRWQRDLASVEAYLASVADNRHHLQRMLRLDPLPPPTRQHPRLHCLGRIAAATAEQIVWSAFAPATHDAICLRLDDSPRPTVICCHQVTGSPEAFIGLHGDGPCPRLVQALLAAGCQVVVPRLAAGWEARLRLARKARLIGREWLGLELIQLGRLIDHLGALPWVDPDRLGVFGFSRGGQAALLLAALDDRIGAAAVASWFTDRAAKLLDDGDHRIAVSYLESPEAEQFIDGLLLEFADEDLASLLVPDPLLITSGLHDPQVPHELVQSTAAEVARWYHRLGYDDAFSLRLEPVGHEPLPEVTAAFFSHWLQTASAVPVAHPLDPDLIPRPRQPRLTPARLNRRRRAAGRYRRR